MKVYVLFYNDWTYSNIEGIFTEKGKEKKNEELLIFARKFYDSYMKVLSGQLIEEKQKRKPYAQEYDRVCAALKDDKNSEKLKQLKRELSAEMKVYDSRIAFLKQQINRYYPHDDETILKLYMLSENLEWLEEEVKGDIE